MNNSILRFQACLKAARLVKNLGFYGQLTVEQLALRLYRMNYFKS